MSWLADFDTRVARWPVPLRWPYHALKWFLVGMGFLGAVGLAYAELSERRLGLGTGISFALLLAGIKGLYLAFYPDDHRA